MTDFIPDAQTLLMVVHGVESCNPAPNKNQKDYLQCTAFTFNSRILGPRFFHSSFLELILKQQQCSH